MPRRRERLLEITETVTVTQIVDGTVVSEPPTCEVKITNGGQQPINVSIKHSHHRFRSCDDMLRDGNDHEYVVVRRRGTSSEGGRRSRGGATTIRISSSYDDLDDDDAEVVVERGRAHCQTRMERSERVERNGKIVSEGTTKSFEESNPSTRRRFAEMRKRASSATSSERSRRPSFYEERGFNNEKDDSDSGSVIIYEEQEENFHRRTITRRSRSSPREQIVHEIPIIKKRLGKEESFHFYDEEPRSEEEKRHSNYTKCTMNQEDADLTAGLTSVSMNNTQTNSSRYSTLPRARSTPPRSPEIHHIKVNVIGPTEPAKDRRSSSHVTGYVGDDVTMNIVFDTEQAARKRSRSASNLYHEELPPPKPKRTWKVQDVEYTEETRLKPVASSTPYTTMERRQREEITERKTSMNLSEKREVTFLRADSGEETPSRKNTRPPDINIISCESSNISETRSPARTPMTPIVVVNQTPSRRGSQDVLTAEKRKKSTVNDIDWYAAFNMKEPQSVPSSPQTGLPPPRPPRARKVTIEETINETRRRASIPASTEKLPPAEIDLNQIFPCPHTLPLAKDDKCTCNACRLIKLDELERRKFERQLRSSDKYHRVRSESSNYTSQTLPHSYRTKPATIRLDDIFAPVRQEQEKTFVRQTSARSSRSSQRSRRSDDGLSIDKPAKKTSLSKKPPPSPKPRRTSINLDEVFQTNRAPVGARTSLDQQFVVSNPALVTTTTTMQTSAKKVDKVVEEMLKETDTWQENVKLDVPIARPRRNSITETTRKVTPTYFVKDVVVSKNYIEEAQTGVEQKSEAEIPINSSEMKLEIVEDKPKAPVEDKKPEDVERTLSEAESKIQMTSEVELEVSQDKPVTPTVPQIVQNIPQISNDKDPASESQRKPKKTFSKEPLNPTNNEDDYYADLNFTEVDYDGISVTTPTEISIDFVFTNEIHPRERKSDVRDTSYVITRVQEGIQTASEDEEESVKVKITKVREEEKTEHVRSEVPSISLDVSAPETVETTATVNLDDIFAAPRRTSDIPMITVEAPSRRGSAADEKKITVFEFLKSEQEEEDEVPIAPSRKKKEPKSETSSMRSTKFEMPIEHSLTLTKSPDEVIEEEKTSEGVPPSSDVSLELVYNSDPVKTEPMTLEQDDSPLKESEKPPMKLISAHEPLETQATTKEERKDPEVSLPPSEVPLELIFSPELVKTSVTSNLEDSLPSLDAPKEDVIPDSSRSQTTSASATLSEEERVVKAPNKSEVSLPSSDFPMDLIFTPEQTEKQTTSATATLEDGIPSEVPLIPEPKEKQTISATTTLEENVRPLKSPEGSQVLLPPSDFPMELIFTPEQSGKEMTSATTTLNEEVPSEVTLIREPIEKQTTSATTTVKDNVPSLKAPEDSRALLPPSDLPMELIFTAEPEDKQKTSATTTLKENVPSLKAPEDSRALLPPSDVPMKLIFTAEPEEKQMTSVTTTFKEEAPSEVPLIREPIEKQTTSAPTTLEENVPSLKAPEDSQVLLPPSDVPMELIFTPEQAEKQISSVKTTFEEGPGCINIDESSRTSTLDTYEETRNMKMSIPESQTSSATTTFGDESTCLKAPKTSEVDLAPSEVPLELVFTSVPADKQMTSASTTLEDDVTILTAAKDPEVTSRDVPLEVIFNPEPEEEKRTLVTKTEEDDTENVNVKDSSATTSSGTFEKTLSVSAEDSGSPLPPSDVPMELIFCPNPAEKQTTSATTTFGEDTPYLKAPKESKISVPSSDLPSEFIFVPDTAEDQTTSATKTLEEGTVPSLKAPKKSEVDLPPSDISMELIFTPEPVENDKTSVAETLENGPMNVTVDENLTTSRLDVFEEKKTTIATPELSSEANQPTSDISMELIFPSEPAEEQKTSAKKPLEDNVSSLKPSTEAKVLLPPSDVPMELIFSAEPKENQKTSLTTTMEEFSGSVTVETSEESRRTMTPKKTSLSDLPSSDVPMEVVFTLEPAEEQKTTSSTATLGVPPIMKTPNNSDASLLPSEVSLDLIFSPVGSQTTTATVDVEEPESVSVEIPSEPYRRPASSRKGSKIEIQENDEIHKRIEKFRKAKEDVKHYLDEPESEEDVRKIHEIPSERYKSPKPRSRKGSEIDLDKVFVNVSDKYHQEDDLEQIEKNIEEFQMAKERSRIHVDVPEVKKTAVTTSTVNLDDVFDVKSPHEIPSEPYKSLKPRSRKGSEIDLDKVFVNVTDKYHQEDDLEQIEKRVEEFQKVKEQPRTYLDASEAKTTVQMTSTMNLDDVFVVKSRREIPSEPYKSPKVRSRKGSEIDLDKVFVNVTDQREDDLRVEELEKQKEELFHIDFPEWTSSQTTSTVNMDDVFCVRDPVETPSNHSPESSTTTKANLDDPGAPSETPILNSDVPMEMIFSPDVTEDTPKGLEDVRSSKKKPDLSLPVVSWIEELVEDKTDEALKSPLLRVKKTYEPSPTRISSEIQYEWVTDLAFVSSAVQTVEPIVLRAKTSPEPLSDVIFASATCLSRQKDCKCSACILASLSDEELQQLKLQSSRSLQVERDGTSWFGENDTLEVDVRVGQSGAVLSSRTHSPRATVSQQIYSPQIPLESIFPIVDDLSINTKETVPKAPSTPSPTIDLDRIHIWKESTRQTEEISLDEVYQGAKRPSLTSPPTDLRSMDSGLSSTRTHAVVSPVEIDLNDVFKPTADKTIDDAFEGIFDGEKSGMSTITGHHYQDFYLDTNDDDGLDIAEFVDDILGKSLDEAAFHFTTKGPFGDDRKVSTSSRFEVDYGKLTDTSIDRKDISRVNSQVLHKEETGSSINKEDLIKMLFSEGKEDQQPSTSTKTTIQQELKERKIQDDEMLEIEVDNGVFIVKGSYTIVIPKTDTLGQWLQKILDETGSLASLDFSVTPKLKKLLLDCIRQKAEHLEHGKEEGVSWRGQNLISGTDHASATFLAMNANKYNEKTNPNGIVNLCTAENNICTPLLAEKLEKGEMFKPEVGHLTHYNPCGGYPRAKDAIREYFKEFMKADVENDQIVLTASTKTGYDVVCYCLFEPHDVLLTNSPVYAGTLSNCEDRAQCHVEVIPTDLTNPKLDVAAYQTALEVETNKDNIVKGIVIINPHNPMGVVFPEDDVIALCDWAASKNLHVIIDEVFANCTHKAAFRSFLSYRNRLARPQNTAYLWSVSKDFGLPGLKFAVIHSENRSLCRAASKLDLYNPCSCLVQDTVVNMLNDKEWVRNFHAEVNKRLAVHVAYVTKNLDNLGVPYVKPEAGVTVFADFGKYLASPSEDGELALWEELAIGGVMLTPGQHMKCLHHGWFRIVFSCTKEELITGITRLYKILNSTASPIGSIEY